MKYVLLDRDGVINHDSADFIKSADEWQALPKSLEAITLLNQQGYEVVVISNQSGLGRGLFDEATLTAMHQKMHQQLAGCGGKITAVYYCPHLPDEGCDCRKPKVALLKKFAKDYQATLTDCYFIGDSLRDIQAGLAVGAKSILVKTGKGQKTFNDNPTLTVPIFENLYDAAKFILSGQ